MRLSVGFATCGRPDTLLTAIRLVLQQTCPPDFVYVCYTKPDDITGTSSGGRVVCLLSEAGLPRQRNVILDAAGVCDVLVFFDDDFFAAPTYLAEVARVMAAHADVVAATGLPFADGARGPGIASADALAMIAAAEAPSTAFEPAPHAYGCNMAIRLATARAHGLRFDERLPLYGWSEDMDFTHRIGRFGRIVKLHGARGVHLGAKSGRSSGRRLGYSQVANPLYLRAKGSYTWRRALGSVGRNLAANTARAVWSEPWVDRRGRLLGNLLGFVDLARGRLDPERVLEF